MTATPNTTTTAHQQWRVVVIDDSPEDRAEVRRLLLRGSDRRYNFIEASIGAAGVSAVLGAGALPDCVLLDYHLPDIDAPEVLAALQGRDGLPVCPVVVLTGGAGPEAGRLVLRAGAQDYVGKDQLTPSGLTRAIENAIERLAMARELLATTTAMRRSERELQTLADNTPDILARFDRNLRHVFVNAAVEKATGLKREEFLGKPIRELGMPEGFFWPWEDSLRQVFDKGTPKSLDFVYESVAGTSHFSSRLVPEFGLDGTVEFVLGFSHDITQRKLYEKTLSEADKRKDEFIAILSHELRNPLAPMRSGIQILRLTRDAATASRTLEMMERQLLQMTRLIDDLLDISRITSGKLLLRVQRVSVGAIADAAVEAARPIVEAGHHTLIVDLPQQPLWLDVDPARLAQVIGNLLRNSAKYSQDGGQIRLSARLEGNETVIQVIDKGLGIPADMLGHVFDMFTQVNRTLDRAQGGLGIGLALVKQLIEMHHGSIVAESAGTGLGSTFTIRLPAAQAATPEPEVAGLQNRQEPPQGRRVLVVDDNIDGANVLATLLNFSGHQTRTAYSGLEALDLANSFDPEMVFLDIGLAGVSGYDLASKFRADHKLSGAFLIAVTGRVSADDRKKSTAAGFDMHLIKPIEPASIDSAMTRFTLRSKTRVQGTFF